MSGQPRKRRVDPDTLLPWLCLLAIVGRFAAIALKFPPLDGDQFWQRWLGERIIHEHAIPRALGPETVVAMGAPWTPQEWLFSTALAYGADHGLTWLVPAACALAVAVALTTVILRARSRGVLPLYCAAAVLLCGLAMIQSFGVRVQVFGWAGIGVLFWLLESRNARVWLAVPLTLLWANVHASVFLAPPIALAFAVAAAIEARGWSRDVGRYLAVSIGCAVATLATPLGLDLPRYAVGLLTSPIRHSISEWGATSFDNLAFVLGALPILLVLAVFGVRAGVRDRLFALAFSIFLFTAVRNVPVFAIVAAPIAFAAIPRDARKRVQTRLEQSAAWVTAAAASIVAVTIAAASWMHAPAAGDSLPLGPAHVLLARAQQTPRVFCEDFAWCSLFLEGQRAKFFMDGRCDPYPIAVWRDYIDVLDGHPRWAAILEKAGINAVLVRRDSAVDSLLAERTGSWVAIDADVHARLYVRPDLLQGVARRRPAYEAAVNR